MNRLIIGLGHKREVGKDLAATILAQQLTMEYGKLIIKKVSFAQPIYDIARDLYGWAGMETKEWYDSYKEQKEEKLSKLNRSPREILISIGMIMRQMDKDVFLNRAIHQKAHIVIIPDLRFPNEAEAIKQAGGVIVKINRPDAPLITKPDDPDNQLNDWTDWDAEIFNGGGKREFSAKLCEYVLKLHKRIIELNV